MNVGINCLSNDTRKVVVNPREKIIESDGPSTQIKVTKHLGIKLGAKLKFKEHISQKIDKDNKVLHKKCSSIKFYLTGFKE